MSNDYKVARKDIYAGTLEKDGKILRSILFTPDVDDKAIDLIYDTPLTYNVMQRSETNFPFNDLTVTNFISMDKILTKFGYWDYLSQRDLNQIYHRFIVSDKWMLRHKMIINFLNARMLISDEDRIKRLRQINSVIHELAEINLIENGKPTVEEPGHSLTLKRR